MNENKKVKRGLSLLLFLASIAGIVISGGLIKEDVLSTARTIHDYFPAQFGVSPASTWSGALWLGLFTSVLQVVAAGVAFSKRFGRWYTPIRLLAFASLGLSLPFDNWTDIVYRSGYLSGNVQVATITTLAFYTGGSEVTQYLSASVFFSTWRSAISDAIWGWTSLKAGWASIRPEYQRATKLATEQERKERGVAERSVPGTGSNRTNSGGAYRPGAQRVPSMPTTHARLGQAPYSSYRPKPAGGETRPKSRGGDSHPTSGGGDKKYKDWIG